MVAVITRPKTGTKKGTVTSGSGDIKLDTPIVVTVTSPGRSSVHHGPYSRIDLAGMTLAEARRTLRAAIPVAAWPAFVDNVLIAPWAEPEVVLEPGMKLEFEDP